MFQEDSVEFAFPPQPTWADFLSGWFIALTFIAVGVFGLYRVKNIWIKLAGCLALALGAMFCFLLGLTFTPLNHHRWFIWDQDNRENSYWIGWGLCLAVWGLSFLFFWVARKIAHRTTKQIEPNAN